MNELNCIKHRSEVTKEKKRKKFQKVVLVSNCAMLCVQYLWPFVFTNNLWPNIPNSHASKMKLTSIIEDGTNIGKDVVDVDLNITSPFLIGSVVFSSALAVAALVPVLVAMVEGEGVKFPINIVFYDYYSPRHVPQVIGILISCIAHKILIFLLNSRTAIKPLPNDPRK